MGHFIGDFQDSIIVNVSYPQWYKKKMSEIGGGRKAWKIDRLLVGPITLKIQKCILPSLT